MLTLFVVYAHFVRGSVRCAHGRARFTRGEIC